MKTQEKNILITHFMGYEIKDWGFVLPEELRHTYKPTYCEIEEGMYDFTVDTEDMEFNISWDWLIPVIRKILFKGYTLEGVEKMLKVQDAFHSCKIETTYEAIIEFILWYNKK